MPRGVPLAGPSRPSAGGRCLIRHEEALALGNHTVKEIDQWKATCGLILGTA